MNLEDWLEWTDARGGTLEEHGFLEWFRNEQAGAWDEGFCSMRGENPYRTGGAE